MDNEQPSDLIRALEAMRRSGQRWLNDVEQVSAGDPRFLDAFRRWEEWLTLYKLHLHRAEGRLLHFLLVPESKRPAWREFKGHQPRQERARRYAVWQQRLVPYFTGLRIDTTYRRVSSVLDVEAEALGADVVTDLVALCALSEDTVQVLNSFAAQAQPTDLLEDIAFYHVIAPWRTDGLPALLDVLRWLSEFLREHDEL